MESLYYVISWLCHRTCEHCYEDRFRPYYGADLERVTAESRAAFPRIIDNLPERMTYLDLRDPLPGGGYREKTGRVILSGGEVLLDPTRKSVLYPALERLHQRYHGNGGVRLVVQTTGDLVTPRIIDELLQRNVAVISVSGIDDHHAGLEEAEARERLTGKLTRMFDAAGMRPQPPGDWHSPGPYYHFFGATPESWIGKLWPRGRAFANELSEAEITDNFCSRWSGGLNFLDHRHSGSEVSIDPDGNVYPCCIKTRLAIGNLMSEPLLAMLDRLQGNPVYEAISMGHPERMGLAHGWTVERFLEQSEVRLPSGRLYRNLCTGCDRFHDQVLSRTELVQIA